MINIPISNEDYDSSSYVADSQLVVTRARNIISAWLGIPIHLVSQLKLQGSPN